MKALVKNSPRKVEVFRSLEVSERKLAVQAKDTLQVHGWWKEVKFTNLKKGDIFRLWDHDKKGRLVPDQKVRGQHVVQVALEDAQPMGKPMLGVVQCLPVKGFSRRK